MSNYTVSSEDAAQLNEAARKLYESMQKTDAVSAKYTKKAEELRKKYHPVKAALSAAAAELTSPEAQQYYVNRAQQDLQTAVVLIIEFGCFIYVLGTQCRQWVEDMDQSAQSHPVAPGALVLAKLTAVVPQMVLPVKVVAIASVTPATLPSFKPIALLNPAPKAKRTRKTAAQKSIEPPAKDKRGRSRKAAAIA